MKYVLLTGATGLLGRYLLRNMLLRGDSVAVLIRATRIATARQRLESLLQEIEVDLPRKLPRPVILEGDLNGGDLGLSEEDRIWAKRNIGAVLHNAASLSFESKGEGHEPWISNVGGTSNVLEFTRQANIRKFFHVSTAYVCGLRGGICRENELDVGQAFGNDYERSKLRAEQMVHAASWLDQRTILRPAIIVGDSQTGFTSTFHGFYTPLKIVSTVVNKLDLRQARPQSFMDVLGLMGHERKNLVPVDWVGEVMVDLIHNPRAVGKTFHISPPEPVSVELLLGTMQQSIDAHSVDWKRLEQPEVEASHQWNDFLGMFVQQMETYRAYWRDDPTFDRSNTEEFAGHIVCPKLDQQALLKLCEFAIKNKFWWSKGNQVTDRSVVNSWVESLPTAKNVLSNSESVNLHCFGVGGGDWTLQFDGKDWQKSQIGLSDQAASTIAGTSEALGNLLTATLSPEAALQHGRIIVTGMRRSGKNLIEAMAGRVPAHSLSS